MTNGRNREDPFEGDRSSAPVVYDDENDVLYVTLSEGKVAKTVSLDDLRMVDYDSFGLPVGVEFIAASEGLDLSRVPASTRIRALLGEAGIRFVIHA